MVSEISSPPPDIQPHPAPVIATVDDAPQQATPDLIRYPPFPTAPEGIHLVLFKDFRQAGIEIFSEDGIERDGRGVPTISLRVRHETDTCKTEATTKNATNSTTAKKKKKGKKSTKPGEDGDDEIPAKIDHIQRARDKKLERIKQFSIRHWYEVWADGEDLRGLKITYESSLSTIDRIHMAATDFRTGRPWPHVKTQVSYLWDQIRLFTGLLGQTPVWIRTDLQQESGSDNDISDDEDEFEAQTARKTSTKAEPKSKTSFSDSDSEPNPDEEEDVSSPPQAEEAAKPRPRPQNPVKRILPRTPYALYNVEPVLISSAEEIPPLLARATRAKAAHLSAFLFHPGPLIRTRILLSSHLRIEGLVYTPSFLRDLPRLMLFWTEYLLRTRALREVERELRSARDISRRAVDELIRTGVVCKRLPDRVGKGMKGFFGVRWRNEEDLEKDENIKRFEDALKAENLLLLDAKDLPLPYDVPEAASLPVATEEHGISAVTPDVLVTPDLGAFIVEEEPAVAPNLPDSASNVMDADIVTNVSASPSSSGKVSEFQTAEPTASGSTYTSFSIPIDESEPAVIPKWDESKDPEADLASWLDAPTQQLFELMGPTILPLKFEAGGPGDGLGPWSWPVLPGNLDDSISKAASAPIPIRTQKRAFVEKSMRRVKSIHLPGVLSPPEKVVAGYVSKGVESQIVERLARIVLEPWVDWDPEGKVEPAWSKPRVQRPEPAKEIKDPLKDEAGIEDDEQKEEPPVQHDPEKDEILLLVSPDVLETVFVGMGIAGTWVQLVRVPSSPLAPSSGPSRGRDGARGRGQGRGRGRGRGGSAAGGQGETQQRKQLTWWYVEDVYMAIPSYWLLGEDVVVPEEELETEV